MSEFVGGDIFFVTFVGISNFYHKWKQKTANTSSES